MDITAEVQQPAGRALRQFRLMTSSRKTVGSFTKNPQPRVSFLPVFWGHGLGAMGVGMI
jgi:hypothetical protein